MADPLAPNQRSLYTSALAAPVGYTFDRAVATSFSAQLEFLLEAPVHLALMNVQHKDIQRDPIRLMDAVRRYANRLCVFTQHGRLLAPSQPNVLFGLLEPFVYQVQAPGGGVFHPKIWLIRFKSTDEENPSITMRLVVLSRNLTHDQSWDLMVSLEGTPVTERQSQNDPIIEFLGMLPQMTQLAGSQVSEVHLNLLKEFQEQLEHVEWELPYGYDQLRFHFHGISDTLWRPGDSDRALIISPFCTINGLKTLVGTTTGTAHLASNRHTYIDFTDWVWERFDKTKCFNTDMEQALVEENQEWTDTHGLHAKVFIFEQGRRVQFITGSANATTAALGSERGADRHRNVEILVEMEGDQRFIGGIDAILSNDSLGEYLQDVDRDEKPEPDLDQQNIDMLLEEVHRTLTETDWLFDYQASEGADERFDLSLNGKFPNLSETLKIEAFPATLDANRAHVLNEEKVQLRLTWRELQLPELTQFIAFIIEHTASKQRRTFVLKVALSDEFPTEREGSIMQWCIKDEASFYRYLLLMLAEEGDSILGGSGVTTADPLGGVSGQASDGIALLEDLVRLAAREPERLRDMNDLIQKLKKSDKQSEILSPRFLRFWKVFQEYVGVGDE